MGYIILGIILAVIGFLIRWLVPERILQIIGLILGVVGLILVIIGVIYLLLGASGNSLSGLLIAGLPMLQ